jgi:predicted Zn-dependent protease
MSADRQSYLAYASDPERAEPVEGAIQFQRFSLVFRAQDFSCEIPLVRVEIDEEKEAGRICFGDSQSPERLIWTFDGKILASPALLQQAHTRNQIDQLRSGEELKRRLRITAYFVAGFALLAMLVSLLMGMMVRSLVQKIPPEVEQEIGADALAELGKHRAFVQDTNLEARVELSAAPIISALGEPPGSFDFHIIQDPLPNAVALPGGHLVVTTGLLEMTDKPEEIAAVLAHEIAHVRLKHGFRKLISSAGPYLIFSICMQGHRGLAGFLGGSSGLLIGQSFSQEYELEADAAGWDYLVKARIDPRSMVSVLKKLEEAHRRMEGVDTGFAALSSHPATARRIRRLEAKWRKLKDKSPFDDRPKGD